MTSALTVFLDPRRHHHAFLFFTDLARRYRSLIWELTKREIAERYVGQALGAAWAVGHPLITIGVYIFVFAYVFRMRMGGSSEGSLDYTTYLLSGLIPWLTFADILNRSCSSVTSNASLVKQILFPVEILPIKTVTAALVNQLVATVGLLVYILAVHGFMRPLTIILPGIFAIEVIGLIGLAYAYDPCRRLRGRDVGEEPPEPDPPPGVAGRGDPIGMARVPPGHDDVPRAIGLVTDLGAVEGDALVGVVVGVEELVPQAEVPEDTLGRAAVDHEHLVLS